MAKPLIGLFRKKTEPGQMALAMMHAAKMQDAEAILFSPEGVNILEGRISGIRFTGTKWIAVETDFPDVIDNDDTVYNSGYIWDTLTASIPFTTHRLGGKSEVVRRMSEANFRPDLQIPTEAIFQFSQILAFLKKHGRAVIKPTRGSGGKGIIFLKDLDGCFEVNLGQGPVTFNEQEFFDLFVNVVSKREHVIQAFIKSQTKTRAPFDIRLHVRRDGTGTWRTVRIYARIGTGSGLTSNIGMGGAFANSGNFITNQFGSSAEEILNNLRSLARDLPLQFQELYPEFMIDALGFDIGLDNHGRPWLFEVNSYPGSQMFTLEDSIVRIEFALFLARKGLRESIHA